MIELKLTRKRFKNVTVEGFQYHFVINEYFRNESVSFRTYPYNTKTSIFDVTFSWEISWHFNLTLPSTCVTLIRYAIENGCAYKEEREQLIIKQGDFLKEFIEIQD